MGYRVMKYWDVFTDEIIDEKTYEEELEAEIEYWSDAFTFESWLNENYSASIVYHMEEQERQEILEKFYDWARRQAEDNMVYKPVEEDE